MLIIFIFSVLVLLKIFILISAYAFLNDFQELIDNKFLNFLNKISKSKISKKLIKFSNEIYIFSVNFFAGGIILGLQNIDSHPIYANLLFSISLLIYIFGLALKFDRKNESFDKNYLNDILLAVLVGYLYNSIDTLYDNLFNNLELNEFYLIFLTIFILFTILKFRNDEHNKTE